MKKNKIVHELLDWYSQNKRDLPWRRHKDPYKIWLSEVILQQTRVDQGLPYYLDFVEKYPTVYQLAQAPIEQVLRLWQGLGYYSRARNLHKCAKTIVENYNGKFPSTREELMKLPGIGPYTAAAISSLAFRRKEAVVDGNVIRVITRLYGIEDDISNGRTAKHIKKIVDDLIPDSAPDLFNQGIMEFGALHCTPQKPSCHTCRLMAICETRSKGYQDRIPFKSRKPKKRTRFFNYLLIQLHGKYLLRKRIENDVWNGLFEFLLVETTSETNFDQLELPNEMVRQPGTWKVFNESGVYKHLLSHQTIFCRFYEIVISKDFVFKATSWEGYRLYSHEEIDHLPKSILIDRYLGEKIN